MTVRVVCSEGTAIVPNVVGIKTFSDGAALIVERTLTSRWGPWTLAVPRRVDRQHSFNHVKRVEVQ